ncbi:MAG: photosystem assembly protein Ycf3 [Planctomycetota bacterium]|nr:photosystem assembly protein Ycf3 [Planctomycetota bacterium]
MSRPPLAVLSAVSALALLAGCNQAKRSRATHSSAQLFDTGKATKVSVKQAADVQIALGRSLEQTNSAAEAEDAYRKALANDPKRADAHARLAILLSQKGDFPEASKHFASAVRLDPRNPDVLCDQGYSLYLQRRWSDAESSFRSAIALDRHHARSHNNLGLALAHRGEEKAALAEFARAGCDHSDAQANLALVLATEGRFPEAERAYAAALAAKPDSSGARDGLHAIAAVIRKGGTPPAATLATGGAIRRDDGLQRTSTQSSARPGP